MSEKKLRYGLIGYGLFGTHHAAAIANAPGAELVAIAVRSEESQGKAKGDWPGVDVMGDWRAMVGRDDIDIVDVVAPNRMHHEMGMAVLDAGKHLFMEKPLAVEAGDCDALVAKGEEKGLLVAVNHELRLSRLWGGARKLIDDGAIGHPQACLIELSRFPYRGGSEGWRYDIEKVGNWILEEPIHFFDLARWYMSDCGNPVSVYARANSRHEDHPELQDNFSAFMNFGDGGYAIVSQTLAAFGHHVQAKITGTKGTIWVRWGAADARDDEPVFSLQYGLGDDVTVVDFEGMTGELVELGDHIAAVTSAAKDGGAPPCSGDDGRWSAKLCLAAQASVDSGGVVEL